MKQITLVPGVGSNILLVFASESKKERVLLGTWVSTVRGEIQLTTLVSKSRWFDPRIEGCWIP
jgi:hypothetical protein